jgi:hypothetical protein
VFLPFSERAKEWEPKGLALRRLGKVSIDEVLDPTALAPHVGLKVLEADFALEGLKPADAAYLLNQAGDQWSGGVLPRALPDGSFLCILNPRHSRRRNRITLMEEVSHTYLQHVPTGLILDADGSRVRGYDKNQEAEAYGVGAAALIPWSTFFQALNAGSSVDEMADAYDVTRELIEYRIKVTGAYRLFVSRQKSLRKGAGRNKLGQIRSSLQ